MRSSKGGEGLTRMERQRPTSLFQPSNHLHSWEYNNMTEVKHVHQTAYCVFNPVANW